MCVYTYIYIHIPNRGWTLNPELNSRKWNGNCNGAGKSTSPRIQFTFCFQARLYDRAFVKFL